MARVRLTAPRRAWRLVVPFATVVGAATGCDHPAADAVAPDAGASRSTTPTARSAGDATPVKSLILSVTPAAATAAATTSPATSAAAGAAGGLTVGGIGAAVGNARATLVPAGSVVQVAARAYDAKGREITNPAVRYSAPNPEILTVDSVTGRATAVGPGVGTVVGTANGATARVSVVVTKGATQPAPTVTAQIAATVARLDSGSGPVAVSTGIPLAPGMVKPDAISRVHLYLGSGTAEQEVPISTTALAGRFPDGSLRSVLINFTTSVSIGSPIPARVVVTTASRPAPMNLSGPMAATMTPGLAGTNGLMAAALLPSDPAYLVSTGIVGPTATQAATAALGGAFAQYDAKFVNYGNYHFAREGYDWTIANFYDRALAWYAEWVRTGNPTYYARAAVQAVNYRIGYLEANNYGSSPHWAALEGLTLHYWLTGDEKSRKAVMNVAGQMLNFHPDYLGPKLGEQRVLARVMQSALLAYQLDDGTPTLAGTYAPGAATWAASIDDRINRAVAWQNPDGSYTNAVVCGGQLNYMVGILNDVLIQSYDRYKADPRILTLVQRSVDYMWKTQWSAATGGFAYSSVACPNVGDQTPTSDLNGLIVNGFGWTGKRTGQGSYRTAGDQIFAGMVAGAWFDGPKQFTQVYTSSYRYLGYR